MTTYTSYTQQLLSAWAVDRTVFPNEPFSIDDLEESGRRITEAMTAKHGKVYTYG